MIGKRLIYLFSQICHIFFIHSSLIFFALKESAESQLSKSVWVYMFLMYTKNSGTSNVMGKKTLPPNH